MNGGRICILTSMGWGVRNVLMSQAMDVLRQKGDLHILSNFNHFEAFNRRFKPLGSLRDLLDLQMAPSTKLLYDWNMLAFYRISPSATHQYKVALRSLETPIKIKKRKWETGWKKKPPPPTEKMSLLRKIVTPEKWRRLAYRRGAELLSGFTTRFGGKGLYALSRRLLLNALRRDRRYGGYREYFASNGINTVVSANPLSPAEYPALLAARDIGLRTVAVITSWDNLSSKRPLIIPFDDYLVWNPIMAKEVKYFYRARDQQVHEIGPLQFDYYFDERFIDSRQEFCRRYGLDPARKIIVYSSVTRLLLPDEPVIIEKLLQAMKDGRVRGSPNLLVRPHPKRPMSDFQYIIDDPRWKGLPVAWTEPGKPVRDDGDLWCPLDDEIRLLTNTVHHGDVNLNCFSTMMLDFAILDKPAVLICHDGQDRKLHYEIYEHLKPVLACKGNRTGYTFEQTLEHLNTYLEDPSLEREGRAAMVQIQCGPLLGKSWQRLARAILREEVPAEPATTGRH